MMTFIIVIILQGCHAQSVGYMNTKKLSPNQCYLKKYA